MSEITDPGRSAMPWRPIRLLLEGVLVALTPIWVRYLLPDSWYPADAVAANLFQVLVMWSWVAVGWVILRLRGDKLSDIGLTWPVAWRRTLALGVLIGLGIFAASLVRDAIGAKPDLSSYGQLEGDLALTLSWVAIGFLGAGISEEFVFRGVAMHSFAKALGERTWSWAAAITMQAALFSIPHLYMGLDGFIWAGVLGGALGVVFLATGRNLLALMIAHGLHNTLKMITFYVGASAMS